MRYKRWTIAVAGLIILIFTWSCEDYLNQFNLDKISTEMEFEPSLAAPLIFGNFTLQDVLMSIDSNELVSQTEDSLLYIYYTDTAYSVNAKDLIELPDKVSSEIYIESDITVPDWVTLGIGEELTFSKAETMDFEIEEGDRIDSIVLSGGRLNFDIFSEFRHSGTLTISSANIFDPNGDTLNKTFIISEVDGSYYMNEDYDMTGYRLEVEENADSAYLNINFLLSLIKSPAGINSDEECSITMSFFDMEFSHIYGTISEREVINEQHSMEIEFYDAVSSVLDVYFADPQFNLHVHNSYGLPVNLELRNVQARSTKDESMHDLTFEPGIMPFIVDAPSIDSMGSTKTSSLYLNATTSNVDEIIARAPDMLNFTVVAGTGDGSGSGVQDFLLDTSNMEVQVELVLPMWLKTDGYTLEDTVDLDLEGMLGSLNFIENANILLTSLNEWPLEVDIQVYFMDENYVILDSLFKDERPLLAAAPVDGDGMIDRDLLLPNESVVDYTGEEILKLDGTKYAYVYARASTTQSGNVFVKFFSHYIVDYEMSIEAQFKINPSELDISLGE